MKKVLSILMVLVLLVSSLGIVSCSSSDEITATQIFERIISGETIPKYIHFAAEDLISQYNYVKFYYKNDDNRAFKADYLTTALYSNSDSAKRRADALARTYKDAVIQDGCLVILYEEKEFIENERNFMETLEQTRDTYINDEYTEIFFEHEGGKKTDYYQFFERYIAGDDVTKYIPFGADGLVSQYEFIKHYYHEGDNKAYQTLFLTGMSFESEEAAQKRYTSLARTYKDDVVIDGTRVYINQFHQYSDYDMSYKNSFDEVRENMLETGYRETTDRANL